MIGCLLTRVRKQPIIALYLLIKPHGRTYQCKKCFIHLAIDFKNILIGSQNSSRVRKQPIIALYLLMKPHGKPYQCKSVYPLGNTFQKYSIG